MKRETCIALAVLAVLPFTTAQASDFVNPKLKEKEVTIRSVIMLPPIVDVTKHGVKGAQGMGKEADQDTTEMSSGVERALADRGISVQAPFTQEALESNEELRTAMADVQKRFDEIADQLYKKHKDVRKGRFTLGDSVAILNTKGTADALVIVRATGNQETKSKAFMTGGLMGMAMAGEPTFQARVALVDAKNGDILFLGDYVSKGLPKDKTYEKSFHNIPVSGK